VCALENVNCGNCGHRGSHAAAWPISPALQSPRRRRGPVTRPRSRVRCFIILWCPLHGCPPNTPTQHTDTMCFSRPASAAFGLVAVAAGSFLRSRGHPFRRYQMFFFFAIMEAIQFAVSHCVGQQHTRGPRQHQHTRGTLTPAPAGARHQYTRGPRLTGPCVVTPTHHSHQAYGVVDQCDNPWNKVLTMAAFLHVRAGTGWGAHLFESPSPHLCPAHTRVIYVHRCCTRASQSTTST
jgi:hypothetical protein